MSRRRVVVTGLGVLSPVGNSVVETWANITAGLSGIDRISRFDPVGMSSQIAGEVKNFRASDYLNPKEVRRMDIFIHFGLVAAMEALQDSGIEINSGNAERMGVCIGSGIGGLPLITDTHTAYLEGGVKKISPFFIPGSIINMISGNLSIAYGLKGPNLSIVTACTTGNHSIGEAARIIEYGDADLMVAGGAECAVNELGIGGFCAARALSTRNDAPAKASRPWDRDRDGFVMGEGAGVLVLEEYEHAKARGAKIYCELTGYGMSADAHHVTAPAIDGDGARRSMVNALKNAKLNPDQVDYINAHGTSTPLGDLGETVAVKRTFGDHAYRLAVSSTKSMTGHLLGAAGGIEAVFSVLSIHHQVAPPTINLDNPSPDCDLDYVPHTARQLPINVVLSNSFGFGGTNSTLIFERLR